MDDQKEIKKEEVKEEVEEEVKEKTIDEFSDIFVTESDTFDVSVKYYRDENSIIVEDVDDVYDPKRECKEFIATFKYPNQGDYALINGNFKGLSDNESEFDVRDFMRLEFSRMICLIRKWSLKKELNNKNMMDLHPKIVKALATKVRDKIGMDGIV